jgi:hypothetical protein
MCEYWGNLWQSNKAQVEKVTTHADVQALYVEGKQPEGYDSYKDPSANQ